MPNWQAIADAIGQGLFGEEIQAHKAKKQAMRLDEERMGLARSADARAAAGESRAASAFEFEQSQRPLVMKQLQQKIDSGELSLKDAQNELAVFESTGGASGAAQRLAEERLLKQREAGRADERLGLDRATSTRLGEAAKREAELHPERLAEARREGEFGSAVQESRIEKQLGAGDEALLNDLQQRYLAATRLTDPTQAKQIEQEYALLLGQMRKNKAVRGAQRQGVSAVRYKRN